MQNTTVPLTDFLAHLLLILIAQSLKMGNVALGRWPELLEKALLVVPLGLLAIVECRLYHGPKPEHIFIDFVLAQLARGTITFGVLGHIREILSIHFQRMFRSKNKRTNYPNKANRNSSRNTRFYFD